MWEREREGECGRERGGGVQFLCFIPSLSCYCILCIVSIKDLLSAYPLLKRCQGKKAGILIRHTHTHTHTHTQTHVHTHAHMNTYRYRHMHAQTHTYTDAHTHTHAHTHSKVLWKEASSWSWSISLLAYIEI